MGSDNINFFTKHITYNRIEIGTYRSNMIINMIYFRLPLNIVVLNNKAEIIAGVEVVQTIEDFMNNDVEVYFRDLEKSYTYDDMPNHLKRRFAEYCIRFERIDHQEEMVKQYFGTYTYPMELCKC